MRGIERREAQDDPAQRRAQLRGGDQGRELQDTGDVDGGANVHLRSELLGRHEADRRQQTHTSGGTLEKAALIANHASMRTTQLYDCRSDEVSLDEVERVLI